ncbi:pirin family protein [Polaribacter tangerinus]|uniref:pirin family protein n=1 Tax=Polaribacter tangerinus TaxID=1920034 RepID=UPI000B4AAC8F|nr:pirin family protein [Polaribacter tangerinus]
MSNIQLIIPERAANIGNFKVGRLLPFRSKRMVGPFSFIDHMGPTKMSENENLDVPPHPHIGLSTLTYLFEGSIVHKDSIGTEIEINPGAVNWMTAGRGVVHSERTPQRLRGKKKAIHGLQIWIALPKELEDIEPKFSHISADKLPSWLDNGLHYKLIAGKAFDKISPVPVHSELFLLEINSTQKKTINCGKDLYGESGIYILKGAIFSEGNTYTEKQILVANESTLCSFEIEENSTIFIFGGIPFPEERFIHWNFVSSNKEKIEKAKKDWKNQEFQTITGDNDFVPLPE